LGQLWHFQCIDTMKYSRDAAREYLGDTARAQALVASQVQEIKSLGATCVSVATPYDEEFYPYLKIWADAVHKSGLTVWFRGNFSGWEGWFSYPLLKSADEHHAKLTAFITKHLDLNVEAKTGELVIVPQEKRLLFLITSQQCRLKRRYKKRWKKKIQLLRHRNLNHSII
jgi:hypothetical protein